ncbi:MAG TPA: SDR family oxidoreductase [Candidatus Dormibacteraeota bacterium]|nr:SDR family oxidoreductase [Candidatus Dormibacteraeota bacterium]
MRIFVTGASGWIGSAVVPELMRAGHHVVALARSDASASALANAGVEVERGDLADLETLAKLAASSDGVIHLAFRHESMRSPEGFAAAIDADRKAIDALGRALEGSGRPLVIASGTPAVPGQVATERDEPASAGPAAGRAANATATVALANRGVRSSVVRLPRSVHGAGDLHGFVPRMIATARQTGVSGYVGDGSSRWPAVHVVDAARLFRMAIENAPAGAVLHAVGDAGVPTREMAAAIGRRLNLAAAPVPPEHFGFPLGTILATDQPASGAATTQLLGWLPSELGLIEDIESGHYFEVTAGSRPASPTRR